MVLIRQKGAKIILHAKSPTFWAAKLKGFTVSAVDLSGDILIGRPSGGTAIVFHKVLPTKYMYVVILKILENNCGGC